MKNKISGGLIGIIYFFAVLHLIGCGITIYLSVAMSVPLLLLGAFGSLSVSVLWLSLAAFFTYLNGRD